MSANPEFVAYISDQLDPLGPLGSGKFFGGHAFKSGGIQFAMIMGDTLYLRVDDGLREDFENLGSQAFSYQGSRGRVQVKSYYALPDGDVDDQDAMLVWARRSISAAEKANAKKSKKPKKKK